MHQHLTEDRHGDVVGTADLCSDACHRDYAGDDYQGWDGAHEAEHTTFCAQCGVVISGLEDACSHQRNNVVVNRFLSETGEKCAHGNYVQLPAALLRA